MGDGLKRVAAQCGGLTVTAKGATVHYDAQGQVRAVSARVTCPRCKEAFQITKDCGAGIVCPYCGLGSEAQWDGEACRLIEPNSELYPKGSRPGVDFPGVSVQTVDVDKVEVDLLVECEKAKLSIITQARIMDMKIVNNRKRMRKRVRQRRKHWAPPHWTEYPGDW